MPSASTRRPETRHARIILVAMSVLVTVDHTAPTTHAQASPGAPSIEVQVDPRVELVGIIAYLADYDEYRMGRVPGYLKDIDEHFGGHRNHPVVELARRLRSSNSIGYDACMSLAVHLSTPQDLKLIRPVTDDDLSLEQRWDGTSAEDFVRKAADFAKVTAFEKFLADHEPLYAKSVSRMKGALASHAHLEWFEAFYGARPTAAFHLVLGMLNGPANYGVRFETAGGVEELYCIFGVEETDRNGDPIFESRIAATIAHEFSHSFVNHVVEANRGALEESGKLLFAASEVQMRRQAYGHWKTMLDESLVRAATIRYLEKYTTSGQARKQLDWEINNRGFLWMDELVELLADYEKSRDRYLTFESFMPRVVAFFNERAPEYAERVNRQRAKEAAHKPKVVSTAPPNGADNVDPGTDRFVVTFDRAMTPGGYSIMYVGTDGADHFPEVTGQPQYDAGGKILTLPVRLKPDWTYRFALNDEHGGAFKSREGGLLDRYEITFVTGPAR